MELSQNVEDEQGLKQELAAMGVSGIPGIESIDQQPADD
jgi:DNA-directed RNA polymerase subunit B"